MIIPNFNSIDKNNFDGVRILLALIVVFAHIFALTKAPNIWWFDNIFDSNFAVKGFFSISGFLITKSYINSRSLKEYFEKRMRRIYPAYLASIFLCLFIGLITTRLTELEFLQSNQTLKYIFANITFLNFIQPTLPAVFEGNNVQVMNGSLWTIKIEVALYGILPVIIYIFQRYGSSKGSLFVFALSVTWVYFFVFLYTGAKGEEIARQFPGQLSFFTLGMLYAINKKILYNVKYIALVGLVLIFFTNDPLWRVVIDPVAYSSIVIYLSTDACKNLGFGRHGDISYGIYLYHFPIIQLLIYYRVFEFNLLFGILVTFISTLIMAIASWNFVEKKVLKRSSHYMSVAEK